MHTHTHTCTHTHIHTQWGLNVVRMGFHWHMVEPSTGQYNLTYIQHVVNFIDKLNSHDVYVILDMHQDCWTPRYCDAHGIPSEYAQGYNSSAYKPGGTRAYPEPVVKPTYDSKGHITNCQDVGKHVFGWASCYVTYAIGAAAQRLYNNDQGILDRFGAFWKLIAHEVSKFPNVLGYELINEPWLGDVPLSFAELNPLENPYWDLWFPTVSDSKNMAGMYKILHSYIRSVDNDTIIFFEPATGGNYLDAFPVGFDDGPGGSEYNDRQALSYHVYCPFIDTKAASDFIQYLIRNLSLDACDALNDAMYDVRRDDTDKLKLAGFLTEFGSAGDGVPAEDTINFATKKMDQFLHGWTYWYLTPDPAVKNSTVIRALARPFPHRVAGVPIAVQYIPETKVFTLEYIPCRSMPCSSLPTEIYTSRHYAYSGGLDYRCHTQNVVSVHFNHTIQMVYVQVEKVVTDEPVKFTLMPSQDIH